jgi:hypothetical protein
MTRSTCYTPLHKTFLFNLLNKPFGLAASAEVRYLPSSQSPTSRLVLHMLIEEQSSESLWYLSHKAAGSRLLDLVVVEEGPLEIFQKLWPFAVIFSGIRPW